MEEADDCAYTGAFRGGERGVLGLDVCVYGVKVEAQRWAVKWCGGVRGVFCLGFGCGCRFGFWVARVVELWEW